MIAKMPRNNIVIKTISVLFIAFFVLALMLLSYIGHQEAKFAGKIYPNVYIDNINIGKKTKEEALKYYKKTNSELKKTKIKILYKDAPIATLSGRMLNLHSDADEVLERAYLVGRTSKPASALYQKTALFLNIGRFVFHTNIKYNEAELNEFISLTEGHYNKPAKDALFKFENGKVVSFRQEEKGLKIQSDKLLADITRGLAGLKTRIKDRTVVLESKVINPEITLAKSNDFGIEELVGEGQSDFSGSIPGRIHNITLSASQFNGVLIPKDKVISFNEIVGDISANTGYQQAYIIKSGRTVLGDGGGVCQTSTTLFRAALNAGLPIAERWAHAYRVGYYENDMKPGFDATVYNPTNDLKMKNNTPGSLLIQTEIVGNILYFRLYGKRDDRKVYISQATLWDVAPPPEPKHEDDPTMKKGQIKQVDWAAYGGKAKFDYRVTSSNPEINFEKTFYSAFRPWQAVFLRGTAD